MATKDHKYVQQLIAGGVNITRENTFSAQRNDGFDETVAGLATDKLVNFAIDVSEVKSFLIVSDQDIKLETNAIDATGGNTINLLANKPYVWNNTDYNAFLLTLDVTKMYFTNAGATAANVICEVIQDPTP